MGNSIYKVPGGKLLKVHLIEDDGKVGSVRITGDFFIHPEDGINYIEDGLKGINLTMTALSEIITTVLKDYNIELFGFDADTLAEAILLAKD